jgi:hypothetical protein
MTVSLELVPLAAGGVLVVLAFVWRLLTLRNRRARVRARLEAALADPTPSVRRAAITVATQQGLSPVAGPLLNAILSETDPTVLDAIALAVARNQWEPLDHPLVVEVRLWAQRRLDADGQADQHVAPPQLTLLPAAKRGRGRRDLGR